MEATMKPYRKVYNENGELMPCNHHWDGWNRKNRRALVKGKRAFRNRARCQQVVEGRFRWLKRKQVIQTDKGPKVIHHLDYVN